MTKGEDVTVSQGLGSVINEVPTIPLKVSRVVCHEDGTAVVEGYMTLEYPVTFLQTNLTIESKHGSIVFEDVPTEFERVLPEEKKP